LLITKKKPETAEQTVWPIKCPYCFKCFDPGDVHFRAASMKHRAVSPQTGETVIREDSVVDRNLADYYRQFGRQAPRRSPVIAPNGGVTGDEYIGLALGGEPVSYKDGVLYSVVDEFGNETEKRLCPYCHNDLPKSAGFTKSYTIAFAGDTAVGKTVYMTTLINRLQFLDDDFRSMLMPLTSAVADKYETYYFTPMYREGLLPEHTHVNEVVEPLIYELRVGINKVNGDNVADKTITLTFYDVAGDGIKNADYVNTRARHLKYADAFIYMVDPMQTGAAQRLAALNANAGADYIIGRGDAVKILESFFTQDIDFKDKPTAIVLTKSDLLRSTSTTQRYFAPDSIIYEQCVHKGHLDSEQVEKINSEVHNFFGLTAPLFRKNVDFMFNNVKYFSVSALGGPTETVEVDGIDRKKIANGIPQEIRVEEPFLWILSQLGIISDKAPEAPKQNTGLFRKLFSK
jgi:GTPase SAR1 family protein